MKLNFLALRQMGHMEMAQRLIENGADLRIKDHAGKSLDDWAAELKRDAAWKLAIAAAEAKKRTGPYSQETSKRILFAIPFLVLPISFWTFGFFPWFIALPLVVAIVFGTSKAVETLLGGNLSKEIIRSNFPTAIFQASAYIVLFTWLFRLLPSA